MSSTVRAVGRLMGGAAAVMRWRRWMQVNSTATNVTIAAASRFKGSLTVSSIAKKPPAGPMDIATGTSGARMALILTEEPVKTLASAGN